MARSRISVRIDGKSIAAAADFVRLILEASKGNQSQQPSAVEYDPYQVLGLPRSATADQVRRRYHQLSQVFHPDKQGGNMEAMVRLNEAYNSINDQRRLSA